MSWVFTRNMNGRLDVSFRHNIYKFGEYENDYSEWLVYKKLGTQIIYSPPPCAQLPVLYPKKFMVAQSIAHYYPTLELESNF